MSDDRKDVPAPTAANWGARVNETLRTYLGNLGTWRSWGVTLGQLSDAGIVAVVTGASGSIVSVKPGSGVYTGSSGGSSGGGGGGGGTPYEPDLTPPPQPTGFAVDSGISNIFVSCDPELYTVGHGHARTNVYGLPVLPGAAAPTFTDAVFLFAFQGTVDSYAVNPATTYHLWSKWQSVDGVESTAPAGGVNGLVVTTGQDVSLLLGLLAGQITSAELDQSLRSQLGQIDDLGEGLLTAVLNDWTGNTLQTQQTAMAREELTTKMVAGLSSEATQRLLLAASLQTSTASLTALVASETSARTTADTAIAQSVTALQATVNDPSTGLGTKASVTQVATAKADAISASTSYTDGQISSVVDSTGHALTAAISTEAGTRASVDGYLGAQYTMRIDVAGLIAGWGFSGSTPDGSAASAASAFGVRANQFYVAPPSFSSVSDPSSSQAMYDGFVWLDTSVTPNVTRYRSGTSWTTVAPVLPFVIQTTPTIVGGVAVPAGIYMTVAFIMNGTITNAKIGNLEVDDAKIANLNVSKLVAGSLQVGQYAQSTGYVSGSAGWRINGNGDAEFSGVIVRGTLYATAGQIGGISIFSNVIQSGNFNGAGIGFRLYASGAAQLGLFAFQADGSVSAPGFGITAAGAAIFGGALAAATGSFAGVLTAAAVNAVSTINIAGNAVTVPTAMQWQGNYYTNSAPFYRGITITLDQPGLIFATVTCIQAYASGGIPAWQGYLAIDSVVVSDTGQVNNSWQQSFTVSGARFVAAGDHNIEFVCASGGNVDAQVLNFSLYAVGAKK